MLRFVLVGIGGGLLFGLLDGLIHANPWARRLYKVFEPIARTAINVPAGVAIDLVYGFALAGGFLLLEGSLPGGAGLAKGVVFGGLVWFVRVAMQVASQWMMYTVPAKTLIYMLLTGLVEMLILGTLFGLTLSVTA